MIKYEIDNEHNIRHLDCCGEALELAADIGMLMGVIYAQTNALSPRAARKLKVALQANTLETSPVWNPPAGWKKADPGSYVISVPRSTHDDDPER